MQMKSTIKICFVSILFLESCSVGDQFRPDIAAKPNPSRLDEIAYINVLRSAFVKLPQSVDQTGLSELQKKINAQPGLCFNGSGLERFKSKLGEGLHNSKGREEFITRKKEEAEECITYKAYQRPKFEKKSLEEEERRKVSEMETYLAAGFGLTDIYCNRFFTTASASAQNRQFFQDLNTGVDALVGSVLNFSGVGRTAIGITNSGFGVIGDGLEAYDAAYLVAPDLAAVQKLVEAAQGEYRAPYFVSDNTIKANIFPRSYPAARAVVERYASLCSFTGMRQLVNRSITDKTSETERKLLKFVRPERVTKQPPQTITSKNGTDKPKEGGQAEIDDGKIEGLQTPIISLPIG